MHLENEWQPSQRKQLEVITAFNRDISHAIVRRGLEMRLFENNKAMLVIVV